MTTNIFGSSRPRTGLGRLSHLIAGEPTLSREDIERDAAAQLGVAVDEAPVAHDEPVGQEAHEAHGAPVAHGEPVATTSERRPVRVSAWRRAFGDSESPAARRARLEQEAAAELGLQDRAEQPVG